MKKARTAVLVALFALLAVPSSASLAHAVGSVQFTPSSLTLNPGDSVVGDGKILPGLVIGTSGGNDVKYIQEGNGNPVAYGATIESNIPNGCMVKDYGIADVGSPTDGSYTAKKHQYEFTFSGGMTVNHFSAQVVDWGDFLPFGACPEDTCGMVMKAYDAANLEIASFDKVFHSSASGLSRPNAEYNHTRQSGDACDATDGQPGRFYAEVSAPHIARVTLAFRNQQSMDPHTALSDISFTPEEQQTEPTPTPTGDPEATPSATPTQIPTPTPGQNGGGDNGGNSNTNGSSSPDTHTTNPNTPPTQTGQVLGATTMAATGVADDITANIAGLVGAVSFTTGLILKKKSLAQ